MRPQGCCAVRGLSRTGPERIFGGRDCIYAKDCVASGAPRCYVVEAFKGRVGGSDIAPGDAAAGGMCGMKNAWLVVLAALVASVPSQAAQYYVRTDGNDACSGVSNTGGSSGSCAFKSIAKLGR